LVKIRLTRMGAVKKPFYRIVVTDSRSPRDGKYVENLGTYDPCTDPSTIVLNEDKALEWLRTLTLLASERRAAGAPYLRMTLILVGVALATAFSLLAFRSRAVKEHFRLR